jgi:hypothetical protein
MLPVMEEDFRAGILTRLTTLVIIGCVIPANFLAGQGNEAGWVKTFQMNVVDRADHVFKASENALLQLGLLVGRTDSARRELDAVTTKGDIQHVSVRLIVEDDSTNLTITVRPESIAARESAWMLGRDVLERILHGLVPPGDSSGVRSTAARPLGFLVLTKEFATWGHTSTDTLWEVGRSNLPNYVTDLFLQGLREANDDPSCLRGFDAKTEYVVVMDGCRGIAFSLSFFSAGRSFPNMAFGDSARGGIAKIYPPLMDGSAGNQ